MADCAIPDCTKPARHRGWCSAHYERWRIHGVIGGPIRPASPSPDGVCIVDDCSNPINARGFCSKHYARWRKHGDTVSVDPGGRPTSDSSGIPTYGGAHHRVRRLRGPAFTHLCVDCGEQAGHWSYIEADARELVVDAAGRRYSSDPDDYVPRCRKCHWAHDDISARLWITRRQNSA